MKFANKFMVVPYIKPIENNLDTKVNSLDTEMASILNNSSLNVATKLKLYNQTLSNFIKLYDEEKYAVPEVISTMSSQLNKLNDEIKPEIKSIIKSEIEELIDNQKINKNFENVVKKELDDQNKKIKKEQDEDSIKIEKLIKQEINEYNQVINDKMDSFLTSVNNMIQDFENSKNESFYKMKLDESVANQSLNEPKKDKDKALLAKMKQIAAEADKRKSNRNIKPPQMFQAGDPKNFGSAEQLDKDIKNLETYEKSKSQSKKSQTGSSIINWDRYVNY